MTPKTMEERLDDLVELGHKAKQAASLSAQNVPYAVDVEGPKAAYEAARTELLQSLFSLDEIDNILAAVEGRATHARTWREELRPVIDAVCDEARRESREAYAELDKSRKRHAEDVARLQAECARLKDSGPATLDGETIWRWMGDGSDGVETLACPVLVPADQFRELWNLAYMGDNTTWRELHAEEAKRAQSLEDTIELTRKSLSGYGYCGEGKLPYLVGRALSEAVSKGRELGRKRILELEQVTRACWAHLGDREGQLSDAIRDALAEAEARAVKAEAQRDNTEDCWRESLQINTRLETERNALFDALYEADSRVRDAIVLMEDTDAGVGPRDIMEIIAPIDARALPLLERKPVPALAWAPFSFGDPGIDASTEPRLEVEHHGCKLRVWTEDGEWCWFAALPMPFAGRTRTQLEAQGHGQLLAEVWHRISFLFPSARQGG